MKLGTWFVLIIRIILRNRAASNFTVGDLWTSKLTTYVININNQFHNFFVHSPVTDVGSLIAVIEEMGNPFLEKTNDLLVLDTRDIVDTSVGETVLKG